MIILIEIKELDQLNTIPQIYFYFLFFFFSLLTFDVWVTQTTLVFLLADQQRPHDH